jgi:hypothetical protein
MWTRLNWLRIRGHWRAVLSTELNIGVPQNAVKFLSWYTAGVLLSNAQIHIGSYSASMSCLSVSMTERECVQSFG